MVKAVSTAEPFNTLPTQMTPSPPWFDALAWSPAVPVEDLRVQRQRIPPGPGVYAFTNFNWAMEKNFGVLYIGRAKSLHKRLQSYLADPANLKLMSDRSGTLRLNSSLRHAGKNALLVKIQQNYRDDRPSQTHMWVRWHECAAPETLEDQLIKYLQPAFNTQGKDND